jgi:hypothetical protein
MPKQLTVHNATITTAAVEVKTLTISGKQVTLAVFRQLREEPLIAENGTLNGVPWGIVNYHPDKCEDAKEHLHVIWQRGDQLRRSYVKAPEHAYFETQPAALYAMALIADGLMRGHADSGFRALRRTSGGGTEAWASFTHGGVKFSADIPMSFLYAWEAGRGAEDLKELRAKVRDAPGYKGLSTEEIAQRLPVDTYKRSWEALSQLPQLFIAV